MEHKYDNAGKALVNLLDFTVYDDVHANTLNRIRAALALTVLDNSISIDKRAEIRKILNSLDN